MIWLVYVPLVSIVIFLDPLVYLSKNISMMNKQINDPLLIPRIVVSIKKILTMSIPDEQ